MAAITAASAVIVPTAAVASTSSSSTKGYSGLKAATMFTAKPVSLTVPSNGSRVQCMKVWPPFNNLKFETLSYLPPLTSDQIAKEIEYMLRNGWTPCLEFDNVGTITRENHTSPGYYDGRYWTMWKLPMFGCQDASQVLREIAECKREYPGTYIRVVGFNSILQVQCVSFIVAKP
eukprot:TRINITY_DN56_c0_g2_i1.p1 TRINITY_DN56_c0_g2~~TRINITY_DN56_c0_g2_i1.p1  ORF type:complete len:175 (+),score=36.94 TRINITY_DN56_c0_g2_i1:245-769(+)